MFSRYLKETLVGPAGLVGLVSLVSMVGPVGLVGMLANSGYFLLFKLIQSIFNRNIVFVVPKVSYDLKVNSNESMNFNVPRNLMIPSYLKI